MNKYVEDICKIGQRTDCCRYLVMGTKGFECAKFTSIASLLDSRVVSKTINARGDNCEGMTESESIEKLNDGNIMC